MKKNIVPALPPLSNEHCLIHIKSVAYNQLLEILMPNPNHLDEYDTPMQEAYVNGYWEELAAFTRSLFNAAFKTNPYLERAVMTGVTRVSRESISHSLSL